MRKILFVFLVLALVGCEKNEDLSLKSVPLIFQDLKIVPDDNLKLEEIIDEYSEYIDPASGLFYPLKVHNDVKYKGEIVKTFRWGRYNGSVPFPSNVFWAKSKKDGKDIYVFTGNENPFDLSTEIYVIEDDNLKIASMLKNDTISAVVPHQIISASINFDKKLISIKCDPNSGLASYGDLKEATGEFEY